MSGKHKSETKLLRLASLEFSDFAVCLVRKFVSDFELRISDFLRLHE